MFTSLAASPSLWAFVLGLLIAAFALLAYLYVQRAASQTAAAEAELAALKTKLENLDNTNSWLVLLDDKGQVVEANAGCTAALTQPTAQTLAQLHGRLLTKILEAAGAEPALLLRFNALRASKQPARLVVRLKQPVTYDDVYWLLLGKPAASGTYVVVATDITPEKLHENTLANIAYTDALTGLGNRQWFLQQLTEALNQQSVAAVYYLVFPRLSTLLGSLGQTQADLFLSNIGQLLQQSLLPHQIAARVGSGSFAVLEKLGGREAPADAALHSTGADLGSNLSKTIALSDHDAQLIPAIGIAPAASAADAASLLANAEMAVHKANVQHTPVVQIYAPAMRATLAQQRALESDLRRAIYFAPEQLYPAFQPIYELGSAGTTPKMVGMEMLARWQHPVRGNIPPLDFIPLAEESGLIAPLWVQLLAAACREFKVWHALQPDLYLSVNLSSRQFMLPGLLQTVDIITAVTGMQPSQVKLEITENQMMHDAKAAGEQMLALRARGFELAVDDFGTGFSSLAYLHQLPINTVKIDRSFIKTMHATKMNTDIVATIIKLANILGLTVTAEGIETAADLELLRQLGCSHGQGFYFAKALRAEEIKQLVLQRTAMQQALQ